jgi:hypothetical protein
VRRTRSFIQDNYAHTDPANGRRYLEFPDGRRSYFPRRTPCTVRFKVNDRNPQDQYARLYSDAVVDTINALALPRYGLGNYIASDPEHPPTPAEQRQLQDLSRAGKRLMGFCRTNLFKRLESSGSAFIQTVQEGACGLSQVHHWHHRKPRPGLVCVGHAEPLDVRLFHPAQRLP